MREDADCALAVASRSPGPYTAATPVFDHTFTVRAPLAAVAEFHRDTRALERLTPPPVVVRVHRAEPLGEGSVSEFTLWFGPIPIHWTAVHSQVDPLRGFTDTQARGPLRRWRHTHTFTAEDATTTRVAEHVEYEHHPGLRGALTRVLFGLPALRVLFAARESITRRALERAATPPSAAASR